MDRHQALLSFCRVVEAGSFAAAARDLDLAPSVVTKQVQFLEQWTGCRLLARTTRAMQLTPAGERFYAYARRVRDDTELTLSGLRSDAGTLSGRIVLAVPVSLTLAFLHEHLHAFRAEHPAVELELRLADRPVDLVREGVDLALRGQGTLDDSSLVAQPLTTLERVVLAAPGHWRARGGKPAHPGELQPAECLPYLLGRDALRWRFVGPGGEVAEVEVRGGFRADNTLLIIDALCRGAGVGLVPRVMARAELADGRLETALDDWRSDARRIYAVYPGREHLPERVRRLVAFLKQRLGDTLR